VQVVFGTLTLLFFLLAGGQYNTTVLHIAGWVGIFCGFGAIFIGCAEVTNDVHEREVIPLGKMKKK
jgi:succinate-acetate transporter protein